MLVYIKPLENRFYHGPIVCLGPDPERLCWPGNIPLLAFTTKLARKWLTNSDTSIDLHGTKWRDQLPRTITFDWRNTWHKKRSQKDGAFIWSLHRKAIAGNVWRSKVCATIDTSCPFCSRSPESIMHRFWHIATEPLAYGPGARHCFTSCSGNPLPQRHCLFTKNLPKRFGKFKIIWTLLRGVTLWELWLERNAMVFNTDDWSFTQVSTRIWQCLQDHGKIEGNPLKQMLPDDGAAPDFCFEHFDTTWGSNCVLCTRMNNSIRWHHNSIRHGSIFSTHPHNAGLYYTSIRVTSPVKTQAGVLLTLAQPGSV